MSKIEELYFSLPKSFQTISNQQINNEGPEAFLEAVEAYINYLEKKVVDNSASVV